MKQRIKRALLWVLRRIGKAFYDGYR